MSKRATFYTAEQRLLSSLGLKACYLTSLSSRFPSVSIMGNGVLATKILPECGEASEYSECSLNAALLTIP